MRSFDSTMLIFAAIRLCFILVWLAGIAWAIGRWNRHARVSLLVVASLSIMLLGNLANMLFPILLGRFASAGDVATQVMWTNIVMSIPQLFAWIGLLLATFGWRNLVDRSGSRAVAEREPNGPLSPISEAERRNPYTAPRNVTSEPSAEN